MKTSRLVLAVSTCLLVSSFSAAPGEAEAGIMKPEVVPTSWSHCYKTRTSSVVTVTVDNTTASNFPSLTMYVGNGTYVGTQSPNPSYSTTRKFYFSGAIPVGSHSFYLAAPGASSQYYTLQVGSAYCDVVVVPVEPPAD